MSNIDGQWTDGKAILTEGIDGKWSDGKSIILCLFPPLVLRRSEIRSRIREMLNEVSPGFYTNTTINDWIDDGCRDVSLRTLCNQGFTSIATVTDSAEYTWPTALGTTAILTLGIIALINSSGKSLNYVVPEEFGNIYAEAPDYKWTSWQRNVYLTPVPTAVNTLDVLFWYQVGCTASGSLGIDIRFHHLVTLYGYCMGLLKKQEYEKAEMIWKEYLSETARIRMEVEADIVSPEKLKPPAGA